MTSNEAKKKELQRQLRNAKARRRYIRLRGTLSAYHLTMCIQNEADYSIRGSWLGRDLIEHEGVIRGIQPEGGEFRRLVQRDPVDTADYRFRLIMEGVRRKTRILDAEIAGLEQRLTWLGR